MMLFQEGEQPFGRRHIGPHRMHRPPPVEGKMLAPAFGKGGGHGGRIGQPNRKGNVAVRTLSMARNDFSTPWGVKPTGHDPTEQVDADFSDQSVFQAGGITG